jgi:enoyl-CoA hydratase
VISGPVTYDVAGDGVVRIALDEPERRNALSESMVSALIAALERARSGPEVRAVLLCSTDPGTFSAGGNLEDLVADHPLVTKHESTALFPRLFSLIGRLGKPVVCEVSGYCLAGGFGLALACDIVVASDSAVFGVPEIKVGIFPFIVASLIFRNVPRKKATQLILQGDPIDAAAAERLGMVNEVVPALDLRATTTALTEKLASRSPALMKMGKDALWAQQDLALEEAWEFMRSQLTIALSTEDFKEGVSAFLEKREPVW